MNKRTFNKLRRQLSQAMDDVVYREPIIKSIQSMADGEVSNVDLENLLTGIRLSGNIPGVTGSYKTYNSQVTETYRKYNGLADWGNVQIRTIVDIRTAFIAGEGLSIVCENPSVAKWMERFISDNKLDGSMLLDAVKGGEMAGKSLLYLYIKNEGGVNKIKVGRHGYNGTGYEYEANGDKAKIYRNKKANLEQERGEKTVSNAVEVILGGDNTRSSGPTTRVGLTLNAAENYDRAVKDMRRLNHVLARITPTIKTEDEKQAGILRKVLKATTWKIGHAFIGSGTFKYEVPSSGAHDNLKAELTINAKDMAAVTGIPIHWLGWVDLMSNRSTADSLYETINNSTVYERMVWAESIRELLIKAQNLAIDAGDDVLTEINYDFQVKIPVIDFSHFYEKVRGWSMAFNDGAISIDDYRNQVPGINPIVTKRQLEEQQQRDEDDLRRKSKNIKLDVEDDEETDDE